MERQVVGTQVVQIKVPDGEFRRIVCETGGPAYFKTTPDVTVSSFGFRLFDEEEVTLPSTTYVIAPLGATLLIGASDGTATVETSAGAQAKVDLHAADTTDVHGIIDTGQLLLRSDMMVNALHHGVLGDAGINAGGIFGTDDTVALQALADLLLATYGGGVVYLPGYGRCYRINGLTVNRGIYIVTDFGYCEAGQGGDGAAGTQDHYNDATGQFIVPRAAHAIVLPTSLAEPAFKDVNGGVINFACLYPSQIKPPAWDDNAGLIAYPPFIRTGNNNGVRIHNITDYNSYTCVELNAGPGSRISEIVSSPHHQIIAPSSDTSKVLNESVVMGIHHNQGTIFNCEVGGVGVNKLVDGPLVHIRQSAPNHISQIGINGDATTTKAIKIEAAAAGSWGGRLSEVWIDQCIGGVEILDARADPGGGITGMYQLDQIEIGKGNSGFALDVSLQNAHQGAGANACFLQVDNAFLYPKIRLKGGFTAQFGAGVRFAPEGGGDHAIHLAGQAVGGMPLKAKFTGCDMPFRRFRYLEGLVYTHLSGCTHVGRDDANNHDDRYDGGTAYTFDMDRLFERSIVIPKGTVLAAGTNVVDYLIVKREPTSEAGHLSQFMVLHSECTGRETGDSWRLGAPLAGNPITLLTVPGTDPPKVTMSEAPGGERSARHLHLNPPQLAQILPIPATGNAYDMPLAIPVIYESGSGGTTTYPLRLELNYIVTPC